MLCRIAADRGARVTGIDQDAGQIAQAAALVPEGAFEVGDILALPYPAARFDVVTCVQSLMHVTNPLTALREAARVARPGAPVVITVADLPPECRASTRRVLTPLESIECDAIVQALLNVDGNKVRAAQQLGMSRATIYRKIREYGIRVPRVPQPPTRT